MSRRDRQPPGPIAYDSDQTVVDGWLVGQDPQRLALLLQHLTISGGRGRMLIELHMAAGDADTAPNVDRLRALIVRSLTPNPRMTWRDENDHWLLVHDVVTVISDLVCRGQHGAVRQCCETAIDVLEEAYSFVDEGCSHTESYEELMRIHLEACCHEPPDLDALAAWLRRKARDSVIGAFNERAIDRYRVVFSGR